MPQELTLDPIRALFGSGTVAGLDDEQLLERFAAGGPGAEPAFRALLTRHGPAVLRNCRRWMARRDDAEDAFQATFLVLARRAGAIRDGDRLDRWLHGVSRRVAARARREAARRAARERRGAAMRPERVEPRPPGGPCPELFEEVDRLPNRLREAVVLCYLDGLSNQEAASRIGCPVGTVQSRLHEARRRLRARLERRGLSPTALAIPTAPADPVPSVLVEPLVASALRFAVGAIGPASRAASLATAVLKSPWGVLLGGAGPATVVGAVAVAAVAIGLAAGPGRGGTIAPPSSGISPRSPAPAVSLPPGAGPVPALALAAIEARPVGVPTSPGPDDEPAGSGGERLEGRSMLVRVLGPDGGPMAGVDVQRSVWTTVPVEDRNKHVTTDDRGEARIDVPRGLRILRLWVRAEGFVPLFANWEEAENPEETVPEEFSFQLARGTVIGGVVRNEDGEPIEDATVEVYYERGGEYPGRILPSSWLAEAEGSLTTDAEGRWTLGNVPAGDDVEVRVKLSHPDYIDDPYWGKLQQEQAVTMAELRDQSATIVMHRGLSATGTVTDAEGKPVAGAVVVWGDNPYLDEGSQEVLTDEEGVYHLAKQPPGPLTVTAIAPGWKPTLRKIEMEPEMEPVDFRLEAGSLLRIRFVDPSGTPVPEVSVSIAQWRGGESLYNYKHSNVLDTRIPVWADEAGLYEWTWAPDDPVTYRFWKQGFADLEVELTADGTEQSVTITPELRISGTVTDASTGEPIDRVTAIPVIEFRSNFLQVNRMGGMRTFPGGRFAIDFDRADFAHRVRIEADGYRSAMSDAFRIGDPSPTVDIRLEPAPPARGQIVDASGRPVEGARVYLVTESQGFDFGELFIREDNPYRGTASVPTPTDARGEFAFPAQFEQATVLVIDDSGYAEATFGPDGQPGELVLEDWARIDGRLFQEGEPVPSASVTVWPLRPSQAGSPRFQGGLAVKTDAQGRFSFPRVPPVRAKLRADLSVWREYPITSSRSVPLDLASGDRLLVDLGGGGTMVKGRVVLAGEGAEGIDLRQSLNVMVRLEPGIEPPESSRSAGFDVQDGWDERWMSTPEGRDFLETLHHHFVTIDEDGRFLINGVPDGDYELAIRPYEPPEGGCLVSLVGSEVVRFSVSEEQAGRPALDLGAIEVEVARGPRVGEPAPGLAFETIDGEAMTLGDFEGRLVLLDFWATWCGPCVEGLPALRRLHDEYGADGRLEILGLSLDEDPGAVRRFVEGRDLPWIQGVLGGPEGADVLKGFGVGSVPTYVLVGPDGTLLHRGFDAGELGGVIDRMLR